MELSQFLLKEQQKQQLLNQQPYLQRNFWNISSRRKLATYYQRKDRFFKHIL